MSVFRPTMSKHRKWAILIFDISITLAFATSQLNPAQASALTLACKLKEAGKFDSDFKAVDQIIIDTKERSFTFRVAKTKGTSKPLVWSFYDNWSGDGCSHMQFSDNPSQNVISGAETWTCADNAVKTFAYYRDHGTFVYSLTRQSYSDVLRWDCVE